MKRLWVALGMLVWSASSAQAIDIRNEDDRNYEMRVTSSSMQRDMDVRSMSMSLIICVGQCEFYVKGVGKAKARGNDVVTIRDGRLITEARAR